MILAIISLLSFQSVYFRPIKCFEKRLFFHIRCLVLCLWCIMVYIVCVVPVTWKQTKMCNISHQRIYDGNTHKFIIPIQLNEPSTWGKFAFYLKLYVSMYMSDGTKLFFFFCISQVLCIHCFHLPISLWQL